MQSHLFICISFALPFIVSITCIHIILTHTHTYTHKHKHTDIHTHTYIGCVIFSNYAHISTISQLSLSSISRTCVQKTNTHKNTNIHTNTYMSESHGFQ